MDFFTKEEEFHPNKMDVPRYRISPNDLSPKAFEANLARMAAEIARRTGAVVLSISGPSGYKSVP